MKRTVSQVAKLTGISVRTLHYYDETGLLPPSEVTEAGYRLYDERGHGAFAADFVLPGAGLCAHGHPRDSRRSLL